MFAHLPTLSLPKNISTCAFDFLMSLCGILRLCGGAVRRLAPAASQRCRARRTGHAFDASQPSFADKGYQSTTRCRHDLASWPQAGYLSNYISMFRLRSADRTSPCPQFLALRLKLGLASRYGMPHAAMHHTSCPSSGAESAASLPNHAMGSWCKRLFVGPITEYLAHAKKALLAVDDLENPACHVLESSIGIVTKPCTPSAAHSAKSEMLDGSCDAPQCMPTGSRWSKWYP